MGTAKTTRSLSIALVVHGRFHAFDLARELLRQGADVKLLTNYPKYQVTKFGIPANSVINCVSHGLISRAISRIGGRRCETLFEPLLHRWFSRWAARHISTMDVDAIHSFSGISEELLRSLAGRPIVKSVVRGSAHIRTQAQLLAEERARAGQDMDQPSEWRVAREEREYEMADVIFVLSSFAKNSFEAHGVRPDKIRELHLGSELTRFRANADDIERRCRRIESGEPLRVLTVGNFSYQKGALDLIAIAQTLGDRMKFKVVGKVESNELIIQAGDKIEFIARQPQFSLPSIYREADIFVFPTIQDGYAVVLAQAQAGGLPILATANCAAPEIVSNNENGWVLPIRDPAAFIEKLRWCDSNRKDLARMVRSAFDAFKPRDWSHVATDLIDIYQELVPTVSGS